MRLTVFCSSSTQVSPTFGAEIELLGRSMAQNQIAVVYGGANCGCMGRLAEGVLSEGGELIGVIPDMDFALNIVQKGLSEKHVVHTLAERKTLMNEMADAFLVFPGGIGTLDELSDVLALKQTKALTKPVYLYNYLGFWNSFTAFLDELQQNRMMTVDWQSLLTVVETSGDLIRSLQASKRL